MPYVLIQGGVVVQKQQGPQEGFIEAPDSVVCGFLYDGAEFIAPAVSAGISPEQNSAGLDSRRREQAREQFDDFIAKGDALGAVKLLREFIPK